ncbi:hypothetical protein WS68_21200 [Burkholderia sp. TSV86]|nr:hypothetical protein WS68_21200 [Burkholderia sp. TSV86]
MIRHGAVRAVKPRAEAAGGGRQPLAGAAVSIAHRRRLFAGRGQAGSEVGNETKGRCGIHRSGLFALTERHLLRCPAHGAAPTAAAINTRQSSAHRA